MARTDSARRSVVMRISVSPEVHERIKNAAAELGVSKSAWCAVRLAEAANTQTRVSSVMEGMGRNLATLMMEAAEHDDGAA